MLSIGTEVTFSNRNATVLLCRGEDALIFIDQHNIKWVDITLLEPVLNNSVHYNGKTAAYLP